MIGGVIVIGALSIPVAFILWYLFVGAVIGWVASLIVRGEGQGCIGNILFGIFGSMLGGFIAALFGASSESNLVSLLFSVLGAAILVAIFNGSRR